jgi:hypothetical protein
MRGAAKIKANADNNPYRNDAKTKANTAAEMFK